MVRNPVEHEPYNKDILICMRKSDLVVVVRNSKLAATSNAPEQPNQIASGTEHPTVLLSSFTFFRHFNACFRCHRPRKNWWTDSLKFNNNHTIYQANNE